MLSSFSCNVQSGVSWLMQSKDRGVADEESVRAGCFIETEIWRGALQKKSLQAIHWNRDLAGSTRNTPRRKGCTPYLLHWNRDLTGSTWRGKDLQAIAAKLKQPRWTKPFFRKELWKRVWSIWKVSSPYFLHTFWGIVHSTFEAKNMSNKTTRVWIELAWDQAHGR